MIFILPFTSLTFFTCFTRNTGLFFKQILCLKEDYYPPLFQIIEIHLDFSFRIFYALLVYQNLFWLIRRSKTDSFGEMGKCRLSQIKSRVAFNGGLAFFWGESELKVKRILWILFLLALNPGPSKATFWTIQVVDTLSSAGKPSIAVDSLNTDWIEIIDSTDNDGSYYWEMTQMAQTL